MIKMKRARDFVLVFQVTLMDFYSKNEQTKMGMIRRIWQVNQQRRRRFFLGLEVL